jgi:hypothetical protein
LLATDFLVYRAQVIAIWLEGYILGTLLNYMVEKDPVAEAQKRQMEELGHFVDGNHISPELSARLFSHFSFQNQKAIENRASSSVPLPRWRGCKKCIWISDPVSVSLSQRGGGMLLSKLVQEKRQGEGRVETSSKS